MSYKTITKYVTFGFIPAVIAAILLYDVVAITNEGSGASISSLIIKTSYEMPFFTFTTGYFMGVLSGHLFWRMKPNEDTKEIDNANS